MDDTHAVSLLTTNLTILDHLTAGQSQGSLRSCWPITMLLSTHIENILTCSYGNFKIKRSYTQIQDKNGKKERKKKAAYFLEHELFGTINVVAVKKVILLVKYDNNITKRTKKKTRVEILEVSD